MPESTPKIVTATSSSTSVNPAAFPRRLASLGARRITHQRRRDGLRRTRRDHLHLDPPEARVRRRAHGLAPDELRAGLLGGALPRADLRPERARGVLREPVLRDPGPEQPLPEIERALRRGPRRADRRRESDGEDRERNQNLDQGEAARAPRSHRSLGSLHDRGARAARGPAPPTLPP